MATVMQMVISWWLSFDAGCMNKVLTPDEFMDGVILLYIDLLIVIVI